ncbi:pyrimidine utilization transport protein G [Achromobacter pestifer]|uniref:Pyrimidine utilization transport protein G n=1 Tax=Achromobacter pestifer TaxID=1353889 RepID=A0A7D4DZF0_9BURK|nr:solute carrier family 23 protein [Achromobacter pestifer]QKH36207.1 pyrimidine utilization transport protein G [Achromobacter pestifer]
MNKGYFPRWRLRETRDTDQPIGPDERLPWPETVVIGMQHVVSMFGANFIAPLIVGFDPSVSIFMSGVGTLIFFVVVGGRVPSYLGSSFAFAAAVIAVTGYSGQGPNPQIPVALGGIIACGVAYAGLGLVVMKFGVGWIEKIMPPVVTGGVVAVLGLNLAGVAVKEASSSTFDSAMAFVTIISVLALAVGARGMWQRLMLLLGVLMSYAIYALLANVAGLGRPIDFAPIIAAPWFGLPAFTAPSFTLQASIMMVPVAIILAAENLGHLKAVEVITGKNLDGYMGRAFFGDGIATVVSGGIGGVGATTYAENIGVMAMTKIYSTLTFVIAAFTAIALGFCPKFGVAITTIPPAVMSGVSIVAFGLITVAGVRIWVSHRVNLTQNKNTIVAAAIIIMGTGDFTVEIFGFPLGGIGTATFGGMALYALASFFESAKRGDAVAANPADATAH